MFTINNNSLFTGEEQFFHNLHISQVDILFCGHQKCLPNHAYGPYVRPYTIIVYIHRGSGTLKTQNTLYKLSDGSSFFIFEGEVTFYQADSNDPWEYSWIAFRNKTELNDTHQLLLKNSISAYTPVHSTQANGVLDRLFTEIVAFSKVDSVATNVKITSLFFDIIYNFLTNSNSTDLRSEISFDQNSHFTLAIEYIKAYYYKDISVSSIAEYLDISREHLYVVFKKHYGLSPIKFITLYRLQMASILLHTTQNSVAQIADLTGFSDYNYFTTVFRKHYGISPTTYRKQKN